MPRTAAAWIRESIGRSGVDLPTLSLHRSCTVTPSPPFGTTKRGVTRKCALIEFPERVGRCLPDLWHPVTLQQRDELAGRSIVAEPAEGERHGDPDPRLGVAERTHERIVRLGLLAEPESHGGELAYRGIGRAKRLGQGGNGLRMMDPPEDPCRHLAHAGVVPGQPGPERRHHTRIFD